MTQVNSDEWRLSAQGAQTYDDILVPAIFAPWVSKVLNIGHIAVGQDVLDIACGTGIVADGAMRRVGSRGTVIGLDINPDMLTIASERRNTSIEWTKGDAMDLPFPDRRFDRVICQLGLQYFDDQSLALAEMHRVLRPGGRAIIMLWRDIRHSPGFALLAQLIGDYLGADIGESMRGPFAFGDDEPRLQALLKQAGFAHVSTTIATDKVRFTSVTEFVQQQLAASPLGSRDFASEPWTESVMRRILSEFDLRDVAQPIAFPIEAFLAVGHRRHAPA